MTYLSEILESYQRVNICPYSVNNLDFYKYLAIIWNLRTFLSFHIEQYALKIAVYVQCYSVLSSSTAHNSAMGSIFIIFLTKLIILT